MVVGPGSETSGETSWQRSMATKLDRILEMLVSGAPKDVETRQAAATGRREAEVAERAVGRKAAEAEEKATDKEEEEKKRRKKPWLDIPLDLAIDGKNEIGGWVRSWRADKGFGFLAIAGSDVFVHVSALRCLEEGVVGKRIVAKVIRDVAKGPGSFRATEVHLESEFITKLMHENAERLAYETVRAAERAKKLAEESQRALEAMLDDGQRPPGLFVPLVSSITEPNIVNNVNNNNGNNNNMFNNNGSNNNIFNNVQKPFGAAVENNRPLFGAAVANNVNRPWFAADPCLEQQRTNVYKPLFAADPCLEQQRTNVYKPLFAPAVERENNRPLFGAASNNVNNGPLFARAVERENNSQLFGAAFPASNNVNNRPLFGAAFPAAVERNNSPLFGAAFPAATNNANNRPLFGAAFPAANSFNNNLTRKEVMLKKLEAIQQENALKVDEAVKAAMQHWQKENELKAMAELPKVKEPTSLKVPMFFDIADDTSTRNGEEEMEMNAVAVEKVEKKSENMDDTTTKNELEEENVGKKKTKVKKKGEKKKDPWREQKRKTNVECPECGEAVDEDWAGVDEKKWNEEGDEEDDEGGGGVNEDKWDGGGAEEGEEKAWNENPEEERPKELQANGNEGEEWAEEEKSPEEAKWEEEEKSPEEEGEWEEEDWREDWREEEGDEGNEEEWY
jgi:cold shock CspA family protein